MLPDPEIVLKIPLPATVSSHLLSLSGLLSIRDFADTVQQVFIKASLLRPGSDGHRDTWVVMKRIHVDPDCG